MKLPCLVLALFVAAFSPLGAQHTAAAEEEDADYLSDEFPVMEGDGITIFGSIDTTQQMETIDRETIEKIHAPDIPSLLEEALGAGVIRRGPYGNQAGVNLRGFDIKRIAILVDGIPVNSTSSGDFDFYSIDPLSIERIEVIHGGSDTKYNVSGALGGIINIITVKKNDPGWRLGGSISNNSYIPGKKSGKTQWQDLADSQNINFSGAYGAEKYSFNLSVYGNRAGNHYLYRDYFDTLRRREGNEVYDAGTSVSSIWNIGELSKLIATGSFYYGNKNIPASGYATIFVKQKDLASRESLMLDMPRAFHDKLSMEAALSHIWRNLHYGNSSEHTEHDLTVINRWAWYPGEKFTLRFGGDYRFININSTSTGLHNSSRGGLYTTGEYSPVKNLLLIASIKGMTDSRTIIPVPKLGLSWKINDSITLKNNYFRSFKFPDFDDLYWEESGYKGNPDLKNEDGWGADLGAEYILKDLLTINSVVYGTWTDDSIHWSNISGTWKPENYGAAVFFGWDNRIIVTLPFSFGPFEKPVLDLSWQFNISWLLTGSLTFKDNLRIPYMPLNKLGISLEVPWKTKTKELAGSFLVSGNFTGSRFADTQNNKKMNPYFLLNIIYNQKVHKNIGVFGKINNVLNTRYFSFNEYPMPGISLSIGINMIFDDL